MCEHIRAGETADAVRLFLRSLQDGALPSVGNDCESSRTVLGEALLQQLLAACAKFQCPYCASGFVHCPTCSGAGRTEGTLACTACRTLGVVPCDFCAGSGLAGYSFFPAGFDEAIASARVEGMARWLDANATSRRATARPAERRPDAKAALRRYLNLRRANGVFANALEMLRSRASNDQAEAARLAAKCWLGLARTELEMSNALGQLVPRTRPAAGATEGELQYREDRARLLGEIRSHLMDSARDRVGHMRKRNRASGK
jgi:hypothetical protein